MPESDLIGRLIIYLVVWLLAVSVHEGAHAWMSYRYGDDTAYHLGRVTLNPVSHIDPLGTLLLPIISFVMSGAGVMTPIIGWGKPTPVNPLRWRNKDTANIMVSIAGILGNLLIALIAFIIFKVLINTGTIEFGLGRGTFHEPIQLLLFEGMFLNISLAIFNLLPIPPLDGSKILYSILPASATPLLDALEQYSFILFLLLFYTGIVGVIFRPIGGFVMYLLLA